MLLLSKDNMINVFNMKNAIDSDKTAFKLFSQHKSVVPLRTNIDIPKFSGQSLYMPAYVEDIDSIGVKIVSVFPKNIDMGIPSVPAKMILLDGKTGEVCCIMDGTYLTQLRTGAGSGAATDVLAVKNAEKGALIGTGGQAESQLEAMLTVRNLKSVKVFDINLERAQEFCTRMSKKLAEFGTEISAAKTTQEAIENADIITTVTTSRRPVIDGKYVKKGAHINAVGSYTPVMQEIDEYTIKNADKVFVDSKDAVLSESGDLIIPINKGIIDNNRVDGEIGEVLSGKIEGRKNDNEITIYKTVGIAVMDVVTAYDIYNCALKMHIGTIIDL
ncbi:MAG: ornithine cyclodeaminase family protein [Clostridiaceae bacterium]|jgi:ornithine cyclodeaminase|nr:ornithine cyclodeaminase family protein [Clostridiaceae bacterium]